MKNSILIALLGLTVAVLTPSLSYADNGYRFGPNKEHNKKYNKNVNQGHVKKHANKNKHVARAKPPKPHHNVKRHHNNIVKHHNNKHRKNYRRHEPKTSFSITFGNTLPGLVYGNSYPERYVYNDYRVNKNKKIYRRLDNQARRIQKGIDKGQLVRSERRSLREEQDRINWKISKFKRDGRLDRRERSRLHQMLDVADNNIRDLRHNRLTRDSRRYNKDYAWH
jgi:hypothetical protein